MAAPSSQNNSGWSSSSSWASQIYVGGGRGVPIASDWAKPPSQWGCDLPDSEITACLNLLITLSIIIILCMHHIIIILITFLLLIIYHHHHLHYVALSDPGVIWGQKYHFCLFAWKLIFGDWNHQRYIPWWQKMQKSAEKWSKMVFFAAIFKIEFSSPMTEHRFLVFSLNIAILSAAQHETLSFLREHVFLWNADNILHLSVLFLLNFSGQIPLITGVQTFCKIFGYIQAAFWQLYGWLQGLSSQIPFRCTLCPG